MKNRRLKDTEIATAGSLFLRNCCQVNAYHPKFRPEQSIAPKWEITEDRLYCLFSLWVTDTKFSECTHTLEQFNGYLHEMGFYKKRIDPEGYEVWIGIRYVYIPEDILEQVELVAEQRAAFWRNKSAEIPTKPFWAFWRTDPRDAYESMANELESFPDLLRDLMP